MPREKPRAIGRDHWIEILRSTGVQTGQSRLHYVKEFEEIADARMPYGFASCRFQFMLRRADARLVARPAFQVSKKRGADRDRNDDGGETANCVLRDVWIGREGRSKTSSLERR